MTGRKKRDLLILLMLLVIILIAVSAGLSNLIFKEGMPFPDFGQVQKNSKNIVVVQNSENFAISDTIKKIVIALIITGFLYMVFILIKRIELKDLRLLLFVIFSIAALTTIVIFILFVIPNTSVEDHLPTGSTGQDDIRRSPLGEIPGFMIWIICIMFSSIPVIIAVVLIRNRSIKNKSSLTIRLEAEKARQALLDGENFKSVIINCYKKMCDALEDEHEIRREKHMTVEEFEILLEAAGAPSDNVKILTGYFEAVRYGNWEPQQADEEKAIRCFEEIIIYFRNNVTGKPS